MPTETPVPPLPTPTPIVGLQPTVISRLDPWMILIIIILSFASLMLSLWLVYNYINRVRMEGAIRSLLFTSMYNSRYQELLQRAEFPEYYGRSSDDVIYERKEALLESGRLEQSIQDDESRLRTDTLDDAEREELDWRLPEDKRRLAELQIELSGSGELSEAEIAKLRAQEHLDAQKKTSIENALRSQARKEAENLVPGTLTVAGMGITGSFFIELTAILTIIFGIIILGIVGVLGTEEIAPILAAIAGYVLGKTTTRTGEPSPSETVTTPSTSLPIPPRAPATPSPPLGTSAAVAAAVPTVPVTPPPDSRSAPDATPPPSASESNDSEPSPESE